MKLSINTDTLRKALARLAVVPGIQSTNLATQAVVIESDDFSVRLRRTTPHASVAIDIECEAFESGQCGVDYQLLHDAILAMPGEETSIENNGKALVIRSNKTKAELNQFPEAELLPPPVPATEGDSLSFTASDLLKWIKIASPAAANAVHEPKFSGLCLRVQNEDLTLFGVDRKRVHIAYIEGVYAPVNPNGTKDNGHMIVNDSIAAIQKILTDDDCRVSLSFSDGVLHVITSDTEAHLPLSEDQPPDMSSVIPPAAVVYPNRFTCLRHELLRAVRTAAPLGFQDGRILSIKLSAMGVEVIGDNQHGAKLGHEVAATMYGTDHHLRCNARYLAELIATSTADEITMSYLPDRNMLCTFTDEASCVIMLVRDGANL